MELDSYLQFLGLSAIIVFGPGPSTILAGATGANFGVRRSMPLCLGVGLGYASLFTLCLAALAEVTRFGRDLKDAVALVSVVILLWLAWKIAFGGCGAFDLRKGVGRPLNLWQAIALQWLNPKAWAACSALAAGLLLEESQIGDRLLASVTLGLLTVLACLAWSVAGTRIAALLGTRGRQRTFNIALGGALAMVTLPLSMA